jgi:putative colanic acid biosynthesis UDP-glucose lipid carrier transferase
MNPFVYLVPLLDLLLLGAAAFFTFLWFPKIGQYNPDDYQLLALMLLSISMLSFWTSQSYHRFSRGEWRQSIQRAWFAWATIFAVAVIALFALKTSQRFSRFWLFSWWMSGLGLILFNRLLGYYFSKRAYARGLFLKKILLIGQLESNQRFQSMYKELLRHGYRVEQRELISNSEVFSEEALSRIVAASNSHAFAEVWLCFPLSREKEIQRVANALVLSALPVRVFPDLSHLDLINMTAGKVGPLPYLALASSNLDAMSVAVKWFEDTFLSLAALIVLSPLLLLVAFAVKVTSAGPVFYRQTRIGLNGRPFEMLKFRSMKVGFENNGTVWGGASNKPVTSIGRFLRKTSLDELPQLINVLKGDMSIVGPRPERPVFVDQFKHEIPLYMKKHLVKAGITGWAQVHGFRGDTDLEKRIQYDLYYIRNWSLWLDFKIMLLTVFALFSEE